MLGFPTVGLHRRRCAHYVLIRRSSLVRVHLFEHQDIRATGNEAGSAKAAFLHSRHGQRLLGRADPTSPTLLGRAALGGARAGRRMRALSDNCIAHPREGSRLLRFWVKAPNTNSEIGTTRLARLRVWNSAPGFGPASEAEPAKRAGAWGAARRRPQPLDPMEPSLRDYLIVPPVRYSSQPI